MVAAISSSPWIIRRAIQSFSPSSIPIPRLLNLSSSSSSLPLSPLSPSTPPGICSLARAAKGDTDILLNGVVDRNVVEEVKQIVDMARYASLRKEVLCTDFLTPPTWKESLRVIGKLAEVKVIAQGGYPEAERCRVSIGHPDVLEEDLDIVAALNVTGNFAFQPCNHGDFLGSILGAGIAREKVGDIILKGEKGAQVVLDPEIAEFVMIALIKVGNVTVSCSRIPLDALEYEPPRTKSFKAVEGSLRIDALASAGFKISRSKLVDLIRGNDVRVNWTTVTKNNTTLKSGDIISVRGKGRLKIGEINPTKKGKFAVELIRYL